MPFTTAGAFNLLYRFGSSTKADTQFQPQVDADLQDIASGLATLETQVGGTGSAPGGSPGDVQYNNSGVFGGLTDTQLTARINAFTSTLSGSAPFSGGGTVNFLRADGAWALPPGGGTSSPGGSTGDIQYNNSGAFGGLTNTEVTARINAFTSSLSGAAPASGGGTLHFLRADGNWVEPAASGLSSQIIYVMQPPYNAAVNGVTDDTAAIQAAIDAASSNGDAVQLGYGTSIIDLLTIPSGCILMGYGQTQSILKRKASSSNTSMLLATSRSNIILRSFSVDGNAAGGGTAATNLRFNSCSSITVDKVNSYNSSNAGISFGSCVDTRATRSYVMNCKIHDTAGRGINATHSGYITYLNNLIFACTDGIVDTDSTNPQVADTCSGVHVISNMVYNCSLSGIAIGSFVESYDGGGNPIFGVGNMTSSECIIANNLVYDCDEYGIVFDCDKSTCTGNVVRACGNGGAVGGGILANAAHSTIVGNMVEDNYQFNMDAGGCFMCSITGNHCGVLVSGNINLNLGASQWPVVSGNQIYVSPSVVGLGLPGVDGPGSGPPFPWLGQGANIVGNQFFAANSSAIGINVTTDYRNAYINNNLFVGFVNANALLINRSEVTTGTYTKNRVVISGVESWADIEDFGTVNASGDPNGTATLDRTAGRITTASSSAAAGSPITVTLTNSTVVSGDLVFASVAFGTSSTGVPAMNDIDVFTGSITFRVRNVGGASFNGTLIISYQVVKA